MFLQKNGNEVFLFNNKIYDKEICKENNTIIYSCQNSDWKKEKYQITKEEYEQAKKMLVLK